MKPAAALPEGPSRATTISFGTAGVSPRLCRAKKSPSPNFPPKGWTTLRQMFSINNKIRSTQAAEIGKANPIRLEKFFARLAKGLQLIILQGASQLK